MTRIKKTRTSGPLGTRHRPAEEARQDRTRAPETKKKGAGLKSGSRHSPSAEDKQKQSGKGSKDPRHGSKKPIALVVTEAEQKLMAQPKQFKPVIQLSKAKEPEMPAEQELALLENDEKLLELLDLVDKGEILTGKDAKYFNAKTARHAELVALLGLDQENEAEEDEDPLAKLERTDWRKEFLGE
ncbi:Der GTPase-activating protein YihI [Rheinheimera faecalis]